MCGIAGIAGPGTLSGIETSLQGMVRAMVHRGPDDEGLWVEETQRVALGMRRLSIIDLSGGHQPMQDESGITIVFNGEIYNFKSLRADLEAQGVSFQSHCDTEVILALYSREGIGSIQKLRGMFAIAIYDPAQKKLHLIRDRLGVKPLYYTRQGGFLYFASELKSLLAGLPSRPDVNAQTIWHYLTLRFCPAPETVWENIFKLLPGHRMEVDLRTGKLATEQYWSVSFESAEMDAARNYPAEFEKLFLEAVEMRILASDVPVGVLLSGGLDSSSVAAAIAELGHRNLNSYNVSFADGGDFSESHYARQMATGFGLNHHELVVGRHEFMQLFDELPYISDEPLADLASIPLHAISREARKDVTVVLSGEGADEMLAGYRLDQAAVWLDKMKNIERGIPRPLLAILASALSSVGRGESFSALVAHGWNNLYRVSGRHITNVFSDAEKDGFWRESETREPTSVLINRWYSQASGTPLDQWAGVHARQWLVEDLLMKADKMSMVASLELRVPFLDHALVEWSSRLPLEWKVGSSRTGWTTKRILRDFAARRLPDDIIRRPKQGFPVPCYGWLREDEFFQGIKKRLLRGDEKLSRFIDPQALPAYLDAAHRGDLAAAHKVWAVLVLDQWLERWQ